MLSDKWLTMSKSKPGQEGSEMCVCWGQGSGAGEDYNLKSMLKEGLILCELVTF